MAFVSASSINDPKEGRLMVTHAGDASFEDVLPGLEGHVSGFAWRDDNTVAYVADEGVETRVGEVRVDGSRNRTLIEGGDVVASGLSAPVGIETAAFVGQSPTHPSELFVQTGSGAPRRATD